jgi:FKBP-type peptidyl-prolyl cis-trans isomerase
MKSTTVVSILVVILIAGGAYYLYQSSPQKSSPQTATTSNTSQTKGDSMDLKIEDTKTGDGAVAEAGKTVTVHYTGKLENGTKFDSSLDRGTPFSFILGNGNVIQGWEQGIVGMKVGGERKLTIPPSLGYGSQDLGTIPPNSTLIFDVQLLDVK